LITASLLNNKKSVVWLAVFIVILVLILFSWPIDNEDPHRDARSGTVSIASWNIRMLSDRSRNNDELHAISSIIKRYDLIAIQEVHDTKVLTRLQSFLPGYAVAASSKVGRGRKERYAFFWRKDKIELIGEPAVFHDPGDIFIREPYTATFRAGEFDFTLCTIHILFGSGPVERRKELIYLDEVAEQIQAANGAEQDVILLGDFNFPPTDRGWQLAGWTALFQEPIKTTIGDKSLYDNIWIEPKATTEFSGDRSMFSFDATLYAGDLKRASLEVSDHRPVSARFRIDIDDDLNEYGNLSTLSTEGFRSTERLKK